jgi:NAD(P)-dependent dehydrogenase (short-subunit alcohol dehydrogenase family)/acyl carrier protein
MGVKHVMNSRTFEYADELLRLTEGKGVDVVLNSLNEAHIPKSLSALGNGGRFVDIGKVGVWSEARMSQERPDVEYHTFDLGEALDGKIRYRDLLARLSDGFATGALRPVPTRVFPLSDAVRAFQLLASGKTIGKLVLTMPPPQDRGEDLPVRTDRAYVISGGLGALGLVTARWLSERGAGAVVLLGRRPPTAAAAETLEQLRGAGTHVEVVQVDVADRSALESELNTVLTRVPRVAGVVHAAGVLSDGLAERLEWSRVWEAMAPKVAGGWNLHRWSQDHALDWFICYASIASVLGSAGQTAYAAANAFLESLMHERRRLGLPGTSIHWGSWAGSGMAAAQPRVMRERMRRIGLRELSAVDALQAMDDVYAAGATQAVVAAVSWPKYLHAVRAEATTFLSSLDATHSSRTAARSGFRSAVLAAPSPDARLELLTSFTRANVASVVGLDSAQDVGLDDKFSELGIDSLLAVDLRNLVGQELGVTLSTIALSDHPTLRALVSYIDSLLPTTNPSEAA